MKKSATILLSFLLILSCCACSTSSSINNYDTLPTTDHTESDTIDHPTDPTISTTEPATDSVVEPDTQPSTENTVPPTTETAPTEPDQTIPTEPSDCPHDYQLMSVDGSTCVIKGKRVYYCTICGDGYSTELPLAEHQYTPATCTSPETCTVCSNVRGTALGHSFKNGNCANCGIDNPNRGPIEFTVNVKADDGTRKSGVAVYVYTDTSESVPAGTGVTDSKGAVTLTLPNPSEYYKVVLSNIPSGYAAKESYTFTSTRANLTLTTLAVIDPTDHSKAKYKVGSTMGDFTLTDIDGVTHHFADLLGEKKLIVLNFWYTSCVPCKTEFPHFESVYNRYKDEMALLALDSIGMDTNEDIAQVKSDLNLTFPMMKETLGMAAGFGVQLYPTTIFIDSNGKILEIHTGSYSSEADLLARIQYYL